MGKNTGKDFEKEVYRTITALLEKGELGLLPDSCKVFIGKRYYSKDREADIITDVSVEMYLAGSSVPALTWIWECKDYGRAVSVDKVEEFHAKLQQISIGKTKGTMITSDGAFQKGALKYAASRGISLARLMPQEQVRWIMQEMPPDLSGLRERSAALQALTNRDYISDEDCFFVLTSGECLESSSLRQFIVSEAQKMLSEWKQV